MTKKLFFVALCLISSMPLFAQMQQPAKAEQKISPANKPTQSTKPVKPKQQAGTGNAQPINASENKVQTSRRKANTIKN